MPAPIAITPKKAAEANSAPEPAIKPVTVVAYKVITPKAQVPKVTFPAKLVVVKDLKNFCNNYTSPV